jgi:glycine/D-amino acid oxidase-like deaminating enzyme
MKKDVIIVGSGYAALSSALHLKERGVENIELILDDQLNYGEKSQPSTGILSGYFDQITRIEHAFGTQSTSDMFQFSEKAYNLLKSFCDENNVSYTEGKVKRTAVSEAEKSELAEAKILHKNLGHSPKSISWNQIDIHYTGEKTLSLDGEKLTNILKNKIQSLSVLNTSVKELQENGSEISVTLKSGETIKSEFIILANHSNIGRLLPFYDSVLIPYSDQWSVVMCDQEFLEPNELALLNFSNIWLKSLTKHQYVFGGARYVRPNAGIGDTQLQTNARAHTVALNEIAATFGAKMGQTIETIAFTGIRACDERPIIGPHFGNGRILLAAGFMSNAIPMGFLAGKCLAEIISTGKSSTLPMVFSTARLRTLAK